jgi:hypothetical protein
MKGLYIGAIVLFFCLLLIPLATFNWEPNVVSDIDNRTLADNPFGSGANGDLTENIENYLQDRIGMRSAMILAYQRLNDKLFSVMDHPTYTYGKDGYVFFKFASNTTFNEYHEAYASFVVKMKNYCEQRDIPFRFVVNPSKMSVMSDKLPDGYLYDDQWIYELMDAVAQEGVVCVDNMSYLKALYQSGEMVFNQKYNAGHWNDLGAFYGVNHLIESLQSDYPSLQGNDINDFTVIPTSRTSLPVSTFPISEVEDVYEYQGSILNLTAEYSQEVAMNPQYKAFGYRVNPFKKAVGTPRILVFQGSYMNGMGYKFLSGAFGEYIHVHDYQNVLNFDYYINMFQPDCVIFETAEYTFTDAYYDYETMLAADYNPAVDTSQNLTRITIPFSKQTLRLGKETFEIPNLQFSETTFFGSPPSILLQQRFAVISNLQLPDDVAYAYLQIDDVSYDLKKEGSTFSVTLPLEAYLYGDSFVIIY